MVEVLLSQNGACFPGSIPNWKIREYNECCILSTVFNFCCSDSAFSGLSRGLTLLLVDYTMLVSGEDHVAKKSKLTQVAVRIGTAAGKADRTAQKVAKAGSVAKKELNEINKQINALKKQLQKTGKRLRAALS